MEIRQVRYSTLRSTLAALARLGSEHLKLRIEKWFSILNIQLGYALDASARNGARLWSKTQPQRVADAQDVGTTPRAAAGAPHTAALRLANLRQVHSPNSQ